MLRTKVKLTMNFVDQKNKDNKVRTFIIKGLHDSLLQNVIGAKIPKKTQNCLRKVYEVKGLTNRLLLKRQFFYYKMSVTDNMLDHVNKTKSIEQLLETIGVKFEANDLVMVLLCSLPKFYNILIIAPKSRAKVNLNIEFVRTRLLHVKLKKDVKS